MSRARSEPAAIYRVSPDAGADDACIARALEILASRMRVAGVKMSSPHNVRDYLRLQLAELAHEVFGVLWLDNQNRLIEYDEMFRGTLSQTSVYPREIVKQALARNAASAILVHNHPSGIAEPSRADELLTRTLRDALAMVDVKVADHFIVAGVAAPLSFAERGLL